MTRRFLILDDDDAFSATLARSLARRGFDAVIAQTGEEALAAASDSPFDYVTVDLHLEHDAGLRWIAPLRRALPQARLLVLTGYASIATTVQAIKSGADDYLAKPANLDAILTALRCDDRGLVLAKEAPAEPALLSVGQLEWEHIQRALNQHQGNISSTARALNMHRRTLQRKLAKRPGFGHRNDNVNADGEADTNFRSD